MAYRVRQIAQVKYGHFGEYVSAYKKLEKISESRGWVPGRMLVPTAGVNNEVIIEFEYPDLATFEKENEAFYADTEAFETFRATAGIVVEGSARTELLEDVPLDFPGSD